MSEMLKTLAQKLNIATTFSYNGGSKIVDVTDDMLKFFIENFGYKAKTDEDIRRSLERIEKKRWQRAMEAIYVVNEGKIEFDLVIKESEFEGDIEVCIAKEGEKEYSDIEVFFEVNDRRCEGKNTYVLLSAKINEELEPNYYELKVKTNKGEYGTMIAVAPNQCYGIDKKGKDKLFGFSLQLYSLKSRRNWGIGDFTDLSNFVELCAKSGGDVIGLNPLNVLCHDYPESASPYNSVSRLFLNPIYIDVEKVPYYDESDKDVNAISKAKSEEKINYTLVYNAKIKALKHIYERAKKDKGGEYFIEFEKFKKENGVELQRLALFQGISHEKFLLNEKVTKEWQKAYESALGSGVEKFEKEHKDEIDFFKFLQFEADRQLKEVKKKIDNSNMVIGLYRDLPVGVSKNSAEVWGDKFLYVQESGAGAPPDNYFPTGQKWGLGAFNPFELKERCYKPFIKILRANMRYAGALRVDHVMGLARLYIIPDNGKNGTYIRYNEKDMMNILALESYLNKCMVVGECIGNVESGFDKMLRDKNIYMLGVLWSERYGDGLTLKKPSEYEKKYFASIGTHDMPPLKAWWFGGEISMMKKLNLFTDEETKNGYKWRECERKYLLKALDEEGVWPSDRKRQGDCLYGEGYPDGIEEATHAYMAKSNSEVFMIEPENMLHQESLQNLPGTDMEHPNWRTRQPVDMEDLENDIGYRRNIDIVKRYR